MTIYDLKPKFQSLLRPYVIKLSQRGVSANQITLFALFLSVAMGGLLLLYPTPRLFLLLPFILFFRMALNAIDGMLAREHNQKSTLGAILNETSDVISDVALYLPFAFIFPHAFWWIILALFLMIMTEFVGVLAQTIHATRRYDGPMGKSDRAFVFGSIAFFIGLFPSLALSENTFYLFIIINLLLLLTCYHRINRALKEVQLTGKDKDTSL
ncbi:CDP-diacylglycerol--glycerol-3-phosphate 3-phosphatidyltransferase [Proteus hauseri ATCC 700826]|uniref:CDP-diacylglycerol--glycerol-3-phosphate 3-phosphatidyltransferase n=1 Tax=Proteus hauseri ATCC 700826 TaxID=1354271 RepID=A0AAJ3HT26_PROHU|nr:CDP-alcohol phosphatidyltransferase family protein [Proteus hauseri]OAT47783.1 CDP-diacylglycerol--glycerol-3-phosphate 3-phosphatidyltransferase [Proteus hauseri ATCC 700826]